jgi:hypothetical protein
MATPGVPARVDAQNRPFQRLEVACVEPAPRRAGELVEVLAVRVRGHAAPALDHDGQTTCGAA